MGTIPTDQLGIAAFTLAFVADGSAAYVGGQPRRALLSVVAAGAMVVLTVEPYNMGMAGVPVLFLVGALLLADSIAKDGSGDGHSG